MQQPVEALVSGGQSLGTLLFEQVERMIPTNPIAAIADSHFLSIISFTLAFSIFAVIVGENTGCYSYSSRRFRSHDGNDYGHHR